MNVTNELHLDMYLGDCGRVVCDQGHCNSTVTFSNGCLKFSAEDWNETFTILSGIFE